MVRLNKYLSDAGICSRREADRLIENGQVTVDGVRAVPGTKVEPGQEVRLGKRIVGGRPKRVVLAVNKPAGIVCTEERRERKSIIRYLDYPERITYAGRLDKDSEGLLIMTNDGDLIDKMMRARYGHEKEYRVRGRQDPGYREGTGCRDQAVPGAAHRKVYVLHHTDTGAEPADTQDV